MVAKALPEMTFLHLRACIRKKVEKKMELNGKLKITVENGVEIIEIENI